MEFIDQINVTSIMLEEKGTEIQNRLVEKQNEYFKIYNDVAHNTQMAMGMGMIQALNNLTQAMNQAFMQVATNNDT